MGTGFMSFFQLALGVYLLYCAISGKGAIYDDKNIKKDQRVRYHKTMRLFSLILAALMIPCGILEHLSAQEGAAPILGTLAMVFWVASLVAVVVLMVLAIRMTDRSGPGGTPAKKTAPRAAFYFDEDEGNGGNDQDSPS